MMEVSLGRGGGAPMHRIAGTFFCSSACELDSRRRRERLSKTAHKHNALSAHTVVSPDQKESTSGGNGRAWSDKLWGRHPPCLFGLCKRKEKNNIDKGPAETNYMTLQCARDPMRKRFDAQDHRTSYPLSVRPIALVACSNIKRSSVMYKDRNICSENGKRKNQ